MKRDLRAAGNTAAGLLRTQGKGVWVGNCEVCSCWEQQEKEDRRMRKTASTPTSVASPAVSSVMLVLQAQILGASAQWPGVGTFVQCCGEARAGGALPRRHRAK
jgi:hypothetical protein